MVGSMEVKEEPMTLQDLEGYSEFNEVRTQLDPLSLDGAEEEEIKVIDALLDTKEVTIKQKWEDDSCFTSELNIEDIKDEKNIREEISDVSINVVGKHEIKEENTEFTSSNGCTPFGISFTAVGEDSFQKVKYKNNGPFKCLLCRKFFSTIYYFEEHKQSHENANRCSICKKTFSSTNAFTEHMRGHKDLNGCKDCEKSFSSKHALHEHIGSHKGALKCCICKKSFSSKHTLEKHLKGYKGFYRCHICEQILTSNLNLRKHVRCHKDTYRCPICQTSLSSRQSLDKHMSGHNGIIKCSICLKSFNGSIGPKKHECVHNSQVCSLCSKRYKTTDSFRRHMQSHGVEYKCSICGRLCPSAVKLKVHEEYHNRSKYTCFLCLKCFSCKRNLLNHTKKHNMFMSVQSPGNYFLVKLG